MIESAACDKILPHCLRQLLWSRGIAKLRRSVRRISSPRRLVATTIAILLAVFWLGQTVINVMMRPPADPEHLQQWITFGLLMYALWHLLRCVWSSEQHGIDWTESEREILWAAPLQTVHLITYRLMGLLGPALLKAALLTIVLLPDSARPELTLMGIFLALIVLEILRIEIEIICAALGRRGLLLGRTLSTVGASAILIGIGFQIWSKWTPEHSMMPALHLPLMLVSGIGSLAELSIIQILGTPLQFIAAIATSGAWSIDLIYNFVVSGCLIYLLIKSVIALESWSRNYLRRQASVHYVALSADRQAEPSIVRSGRKHCLPRIPFLGGVGPLVSRQLVTVKKYWGVVVVTLAIPAVMSTFPIWVLPADQPVLLHVAGSLVFYTMLLGPPALKIDFRRDLNRLLVLRSLPINPLKIVHGQLLAPIMICVAFQATVLLLAWIVRPISPVSLLLTFASLVPITTIIFAIENAIFLTFPHHRHQEGIDILLRTILVFTFKGILFAAGIAAMLLWSLVTKTFLPFELQPAVFSVGGIVLLWMASLATTSLTAFQFKRLDFSADIPAA